MKKYIIIVLSMSTKMLLFSSGQETQKPSANPSILEKETDRRSDNPPHRGGRKTGNLLALLPWREEVGRRGCRQFAGDPLGCERPKNFYSSIPIGPFLAFLWLIFPPILAYFKKSTQRF
jgi:hypothetical protein